jgi:hypothetical protein
MVEFDEESLEADFEAFLDDRDIYKVECRSREVWERWKGFNRVEFPGDPDESKESLSVFDTIEIGDIILAQQAQRDNDIRYTYGFGVVAHGDQFYDSESIPRDPDTGDPLALRVSWTTVADNGEHITADVPTEFPEDSVTAVSREYFEDLLQGLRGESFPPDNELLIERLFAAAARRNLDEVIDQYLFSRSTESAEWGRMARFVVEEYLQTTLDRFTSAERRELAIPEVASVLGEEPGHMEATLVELFSESEDDADVSILDHALQEIEDTLQKGAPWENPYTSDETPEFGLAEWLAESLDDDFEYFILKTGDDEYDDEPDSSYHFRENIPGCNQLNTAVPDVRFVYLEDGEFYAVGSLGEVETRDRDGVSHYFAEVTQYHEIDPIPREAVEEQLTIDFPIQYGIIKVEESDYEHILGTNIARDPQAATDELLEEESTQAHLYRQALAHLVAGKNLVFYGPPGTGKTRAARKLSNAICAGDYSLVTANAEWSNYQVVGGYAPSEDGFEPQQGFLTRAAADCQQTLQQPADAHPTWLLIDELNRANLDEAFGDVFTLLDIDYRTSRKLSYAPNADDVPVPLSFRILATMNTYDQAQLFSLGYAFRRRFAFVRVPSLMDGGSQAPATSEPTSDPSPDDLSPSSETTMAVVRDVIPEYFLLGTDDDAGVSTADVAAILGNLATQSQLQQAMDALDEHEELRTGSLDWLQTLVYFAQEVIDREIVEIGQALLIDAAQYVVAYQLLFPEHLDRSVLDQAVVSYLVPQFEHFMPKLRRAETIDQDSSAGKDFQEIIDLANQLGLSETGSVLDTAKKDKRVLE